MRKCGRDGYWDIISSNPSGFPSWNRKSTSGKTFVRFSHSISGNPFRVFGNDIEDLNLNHVNRRRRHRDTQVATVINSIPTMSIHTYIVSRGMYKVLEC